MLELVGGKPAEVRLHPRLKSCSRADRVKEVAGEGVLELVGGKPAEANADNDASAAGTTRTVNQRRDLEVSLPFSTGQ